LSHKPLAAIFACHEQRSFFGHFSSAARTVSSPAVHCFFILFLKHRRALLFLNYCLITKSLEALQFWKIVPFTIFFVTYLIVSQKRFGKEGKEIKDRTCQILTVFKIMFNDHQSHAIRRFGLLEQRENKLSLRKSWMYGYHLLQTTNSFSGIQSSNHQHSNVIFTTIPAVHIRVCTTKPNNTIQSGGDLLSSNVLYGYNLVLWLKFIVYLTKNFEKELWLANVFDDITLIFVCCCRQASSFTLFA